MIWARAENAASLPLGCLSWNKWLNRLEKLEVLPPMERPWAYEGRTMKNTLVVRMTMGVDKGETSITAAVHHMTQPRPILSLGILEQPTGEKRIEIVVETWRTKLAKCAQVTISSKLEDGAKRPKEK